MATQRHSGGEEVGSPGDSLTIVAIPDGFDDVWKVSSEKIPHMTLLFLGDQSENSNLDEIVQFVAHASSRLDPFGMPVRERGVLGDHDADVLFFEGYPVKELEHFRSMLLANDHINKAYLSVDQYPSWTPHLTLGYPETPAKDVELDHPLTGVSFNKIAIWTGDYEGPTFHLKHDIRGEEVRMGDQAVEDALSHFGVTGMRWGVRRDKIPVNSDGSESVVVTQRKPGSRLKVKGGRNHPADPDAVSALAAKRKAGKSGIHSLSNKELQTLVTRMNLEQQFSNLNTKDSSFHKGEAFVKKAIGTGKTVQEVNSVINSPVGKQVRRLLIGLAIKKTVKATSQALVRA